METHQLAYAALAIWALKEIYATFKNNQSKHTDAILQNTHAILELKVELKFIREIIAEFPKLKQDIHSAHSKIRDLNGKMG